MDDMLNLSFTFIATCFYCFCLHCLTIKLSIDISKMVYSHRNSFHSTWGHKIIKKKVLSFPPGPGWGGGGVLPEKLGRGVQPASQNPYPIYDQNLRFSLPYL